MRLSYDPKYNVAYIRFQSKSSEVESIKISEELIIDIAPDGTLFGIELLNANEQLQREDMGRILIVNKETGDQVELPLTR